ncbi:MAG: RNA-binding protein [Desulfobulbaceae bacterium A2]|nr:MAG: RNA-binding protein [Desulfobulbaceae bacterium A2]
MNVYVGNLPYGMTDDELRALFQEFGEVSRAQIVIDKPTGRSKGFGFVEMPDNAQAEEAIKSLNDKMVKGRNIKVNQARPREDRGGEKRSFRPREY